MLFPSEINCRRGFTGIYPMILGGILLILKNLGLWLLLRIEGVTWAALFRRWGHIILWFKKSLVGVVSLIALLE